MRLQSRSVHAIAVTVASCQVGDVMTDISKTRKQNSRGPSPAVAEAPPENVEYPPREHERTHGQGGAVTAKPQGEPPGSPSYYGQPQQTSERGPREASGSYARPGTPSAGPAVKAIGEPPGSPAYYGEVSRHEGARAEAPYADRRTQPRAKAAPIGDPPGSPSYFGNAAQGATGHRAPQSSSQYGQTQMMRRAGTIKPIGEPPGSAQYFGRSGDSSAQGPYGQHRQVPMSQSASAPQYSPGQPSGGRAPNAAQTLATVGLPPGSAAYSGRMTRGGSGAG